MPRVADLVECPLCFGRLMPLSVCQSCNSIAVRDGLEEVGPQIGCEDCGATNATYFVCSACNARFPYDEIAKPRGPTCPVCKSPVPPGAPLCPACGAVLPGAMGVRLRRRIRGEYSEADVQEVSRIPGVGRQRAEALCKSGYHALWKIARAAEGQLARVRGVGPRAAAQIREQIGLLQIVARPKTKEEVLSEEYDCPLCGTVTSVFATRCHDCGAAFDEEDLDEELAREVEREEEKGLLAYYDVRLLETPENVGLLYARSLLLLSMRRPMEALASLDKVLEVESGNRRALEAKARALGSVKGLGSSAQVLRGLVAITGGLPAPPEPSTEEKAEEEALRALGGLEQETCPVCGEAQAAGAPECRACGHRFVPEAPPPPAEMAPPPPAVEDERMRLLEDLERAVAGETKSPPPPLKPVVPETVVDRKREMYTALLGVPGVSRRAAEAVSAFFQDMDQLRLADVEDVQEIPGVAPAEARLIHEAVERHFARAEAVPPPPPAEEAPALEERPAPPRPAPAPMPRRVPAVRRPLEITAGRRGLVNGKGLVNGRGRVNGLINGTGFVNGGSLGEPRLPHQNLMPRYIAVGASLLMLFGFAVAFIPSGPPGSAITIDGRFNDWDGIPQYWEPSQSVNADVQIVSTSVRHQPGDSSVFARVRVSQTAFGDPTDYDTLYAFIDTDGNMSTGYEVLSIGADYLARVSGSNGRVEDARLLRFDGPDSVDWTGWTSTGTVSASSSGHQVELAVSVDALDGQSPSVFDANQFRVLFVFDDNVGEASHTWVPVGRGRAALLVRQWTFSQRLGSGSGQRVLGLEFRALGGTVEIQSVTLRTTPNQGFDSVGAVPALAANETWITNVAMDTTGIAVGTAVSARVASVEAGGVPHEIIGVEARAYVVQPPAGKRIDGLFEDWTNVSADTDSQQVRRPSLDILGREGAVIGDEVLLYAHLAGNALEGRTVPQRLARPQPAGGSGGAPGTGPTPPPLVGQDYIRFYLDTNASEPGGYDVNGLLVDRYVEVRGRGGIVTNASAYRWSGSDWRWEADVNVRLGVNEIELNATISVAAFNMTRVVAVTGDWSGVADVADASSTGTRGAPALVPLHGTSPLTAVVLPLINIPTLDGSCGSVSDEYAGSNSYTNASYLKFFVGRRSSIARLYVCLEVTADGTNDSASDFGELLFDTNHNGSNSPHSEDRRFRLLGDGTFAQELGDSNGGWTPCGGSCDAGNAAATSFNNSRMTYEFNISFTDVWGTPSPGAAQTAGFAIWARNATGVVDYTWGNDGVSRTNPSTWGHLQIPEFPEATAFLVSISAPFLLARLRRRRR